jgi:hypothetical protein
MDKTRRVKYEKEQKTFKFSIRDWKSWEDKFTVKPAALGAQRYSISRLSTVLGREEIEVGAGKFRTFKIEYKQEILGETAGVAKAG